MIKWESLESKIKYISLPWQSIVSPVSSVLIMVFTLIMSHSNLENTVIRSLLKTLEDLFYVLKCAHLTVNFCSFWITNKDTWDSYLFQKYLWL